MAEETMRCLKPVCYTKLSTPRRMRLDVCEHNVWAKNRKAIWLNKPTDGVGSATVLM